MRSQVRARIEGVVPDGTPGHAIDHPAGVTVPRWPTSYLTPDVETWLGLFEACRAAGVPPMSSGLLSWPAPLAEAWRVLSREFDHRERINRK